MCVAVNEENTQLASRILGRENPDVFVVLVKERSISYLAVS